MLGFVYRAVMTLADAAALVLLCFISLCMGRGTYSSVMFDGKTRPAVYPVIPERSVTATHLGGTHRQERVDGREEKAEEM